MGRVKETRGCGVHCGGRAGAGAMVTVGVLYTLACLGGSLTLRVYLRSCYTAAYVAGLGVMVGLFVLANHACRVRRCCGCGLRAFSVWQSVLNTWLLLCSLVAAGCYALLVALAAHANYDLTAAMIVSWLNSLLLLYLLCLSAQAARKDRYSDYRLDRAARSNAQARENSGVINFYQMSLYGGEGGAAGAPAADSKSELESGRGRGAACCCGFLRVVFGLGYFLLLLLLVLVFSLAACHPAFLAVDSLCYREAEHMYTVEVEGHAPLALFLKCRGGGNETVVVENGLGGTAYMAWDFLPARLADHYRVCVHDRRGYGWSETAESEGFALAEPQWAPSNSRFFIALVEQAAVPKPFYYLGHSYGGHHLVHVALTRPDLLKGLIFLDSAEFTAIDTLHGLFEVASNFRASGVLFPALQLFRGAALRALDEIGDFSGLAADTADRLLAAVRAGYYFESERREWGPLADDSAKRKLEEELAARNVSLPLLLLDQAGRDRGWFPAASFLRYDEALHLTVPCSTHTGLMYDAEQSAAVAAVTHAFIRRQQGALTAAAFSAESAEQLGSLHCGLADT